MISFLGVTVDGILSPITLDIAEQRVGVIGPNGSGKSTFARLINGLTTPTHGTVAAPGKVGFVFSDAENQIIMPKVRDDVAFSLRKKKLSKQEKNKLIDATLHRFDLSDHAEDSPHTLSGGEKQLLALAAVCILDPDVIVADEPTTLLDLRNRRRIKQVFSELEQQLVTVTHDLELIEDYDRVIRIDNGAIFDDGLPHDVIKRYVEDMR